MAAVPLIQAGVSVIGGVAAMSAKNRAAQAERTQIQQQQLMERANSLAAQQQLYTQQVFNEQQSMLSQLSRKAEAQQQDLSLAAQSATVDIERQRQVAAVAMQEQQQALAVQQQRQQLAQAEAQTQLTAAQQDSASSKRSAELASSVGGAIQQAAAQLDDADRKALVLAAARSARAGSSDVAQTRAELSAAVQALASANEADKAVLEGELQRMSEQDVTSLQRQLASQQIDAATGVVNTNEQLGAIASRTAKGAINANAASTQSAIQSSQQANSLLQQLAERTASAQTQLQRDNYNQQQSLTSNTSTSVQAQLEDRKQNVRGASLVDALAIGASAAGALAKPGGGVAQPKGAPSYMPVQDLGGSSYIPPNLNTK